MTAATLTVYPGLNSAGTSLTVYAEDGVTLIPPSGATVTYSSYYAALLANGTLLTSDPLSTSGNPLQIDERAFATTPEMFGAVGDGTTDDSGAIQAALDLIHEMGSGKLLLSKLYAASDLIAYGNTSVEGSGEATGLIVAGSSATYAISVNPGTGGTPDPDDNEQNIALRNFSITGPIATLGFSEHKHLVNMNAVTNLVIEDMVLRGARGDAIYIGSSNVAATERHNKNVVIQRCMIDGVNADNRNGISVIDCDGFKILHNRIIDCTRTGQPGSICLEPDANAFAIIRNGLIGWNEIVGGEEGGITLNLRPQSALTTKHSNIVVEGNYVSGKTSGFNFNGETSGGGASASTPSYGVTFRGNIVEDCTRGYLINGAAGVRLHDNHYKECDAAELGYTETNFGVEVVRELFEGCGKTTVNALIVRSSDTVAMDSCRFVDCGLTASGAGGRAIQFQGTISRLKWRNLTFESPTGRTTYAVQNIGTIDESTCEEVNTRYEFTTNTDVKLPGGNRLTAAPVTGTWKVGDIVYNRTPTASAATPYAWLCVVAGTPGTWVPLWHSGSQDNTAYTPAISAAGVAITLGDGTLSGSYTRSGNIVVATVKLTIGGTTSIGVGELRIGLPITSAAPEFVGRVSIADAGAGLYYGADAILQGSAVYAIGVLNAGAILSGTNPVTLATGDVVRMTVSYTV